MCAGLKNGKFRRGAVGGPEAVKASGEKRSESRSDRDTGDKIAIFGDGSSVWASVISEFRMVESLSHEVREWDGT